MHENKIHAYKIKMVTTNSIKSFKKMVVSVLLREMFTILINEREQRNVMRVKKYESNKMDFSKRVQIIPSCSFI
jgi:hypothetical protein